MARWQSCNVLEVGADRRHVWQFETRNGQLALGREQTAQGGLPLPPALLAKPWTALWKPKLNIAWLPAENVFLRVIQVPKSSVEETCSMVELQLEKLSPIPVTQVVWSLHILPQATGELQTVIVVLAERNAVEQFLGQLEGQGYLADRLELPVLDQLAATTATEDGAWIFPIASAFGNSALIGWWHEGALQSVSLIMLPEIGDRLPSLREQLSQITWSGELEGWIGTSPQWHLVAEGAIAGAWETILREAVDAPVKVIAPIPVAQLANLTAQRAVTSEIKANLLPPEFAVRYKQQFQDRLWMRGLGVVLAIYVSCVAVYMLALGVVNWQTTKVEDHLKELGPTYTNAMQLEARLDILKDRQALKFAALDSWRAVAETLPEALQLEGFNFSEGRKLMLNGTAGAGSEKAILDFSDELRKVRSADGQVLFDPTKADPPNYFTSPGGGLSWRFNWELKRVEVQ